MFNFKKIASVLASAVMLSSTVGFAFAATYPEPFVTGGLADGAVVYGANAAVSDVTAAINVQQKLGALATSGSATTSASVTGGESYPLFTTSSPLLLNNSISSVRSSITSTSLPVTLADSTFEGDQTASLTYNIKIGTNPRVVYAKMPTSSDDPVVGVKLSTSISNYLYNATVTFSKAIMFNHSDSEGQTIEMFGQEYTVSSSTDGENIYLFKSAQKISLTSDNPSADVTIAGSVYTIELVSSSDTAATIKVTDSSGASESKEISESNSKKVNGVDIAVSTADETNLQLSASIIAGADRVKLGDGSEVQVGTDNDPIEGTQVSFGGDSSEKPNNITKIVFQVAAPDGSNDAIFPGNSFVDPVFGSFKIDFAGLNINEDSTSREDISIDSSGNDKMTISFTNHQDKSVSNFEWLNNETGGGMAGSKLGDSSELPLFVYEMARINESAYTVVGNEDEGYLVKLLTLSNSSSTDSAADSVRFQNVFDSTQTWETSISSEGAGTVIIGSSEYTVAYNDNRNGNGDEYVTLNSPDSSGNQMVIYPTIQTSKGAKVMFYEPVTVDFDNWTGGANLNVTNIKIPDGDGFTSINILKNDTGDPVSTEWNITFSGGSSTMFNTSSADAQASVNGSVGRLTWSVASAGDGRANTAKIYLVDPDGGIIRNPAIVVFEEKDELNTYEAVIIQTGGNGDSNNGMGVSDVDFTWNLDNDIDSASENGAAGFQTETDENIYKMMDYFGTIVTTDQSTSDQYSSVISYPDEQVYAQLYIAQESAAITPGTTGSSGGGQVVIVKDTEVSSVASKNLFVVGGSCINSVAAKILGSDSPLCTSDFTDKTGAGVGQYIIKTVASPYSEDKVAMLVAGYEAAETELAVAKALEGVKADAGTEQVYPIASTATEEATE